MCMYGLSLLAFNLNEGFKCITMSLNFKIIFVMVAMMLCLNKWVGYHGIIHDIKKSEAIPL